jgi:hypothetical protein
VGADSDGTWAEEFMRERDEHGNYLLDREGVIVWRQYGHADPSEVEAEVKALLAE